MIISYSKSQGSFLPTDNNSWFTHLIVYTNLIPISFYGFFDISAIIEKFRFEHSKKKLLSSNKEQKLIVNDGDILTDLAHINHVFLDKTGTLTSEKVEIAKIFVNDKIYEFDEKFLKKYRQRPSMQQKKEKDMMGSDRNLKNIDEELGNLQVPSFQSLLTVNKLVHPENIEEKRTLIEMSDININSLKKVEKTEEAENSPVKKNLHLNNIKETGENFFSDMEMEEPLKELIKTFVFCHNARVVYEGVEKSYFQSNRKEEEVLLDFAKNAGVCLEQVTKSDMKGFYLIKKDDKKVNHTIIGTNEYSNLRRRFSLLMDDGEEGAKLYCKGSLEAMKDCLLLGEEDADILALISSYFKEQGLKMMVYAGKKFNKSETGELSNRLRNLKFSLMSQEEELEELAKEMEVKLELRGIVGFKEKVRKQAPELIRFFQDIEAGIWIVSGDGYQNVLNCAINTNLLDLSKSEAFRVEAENIEDISISIRNILTEIRMILDPYKQERRDNQPDADNFFKRSTIKQRSLIGKPNAFKNKYFILNGKSLDIIMNNVYLRDHFMFIASFTKVLLGYNLSPQNKQALVRIVRNYFVDNPNVLAIGDGLNDTQMMQSANVGIELLHRNKKKEYEINNNYGDILISNLDMVKPLMIFKGKDLYERVDRLMGILIYKDVLICLTFFVYNWSYNFANHQLYESYFVFFYDHVFFVCQTLLFVLYNQRFRVDLLKFFPALYMDGALRMRAKIPKPYIKNLIEGLLISVMIIYVTSEILGDSVDCNGKEIDFEAVQWVFVFSLFFIMGLKVKFI